MHNNVRKIMQQEHTGSLGHGTWSMEHGAWSMGHEAWGMELGHGTWIAIIYGQILDLSSKI